MMNESEIQNIKQRFSIIGNSPLLNNAILRAVQVAPTDMSVLITGESGTGKESFSKIIHQLSTRKHAQFIAINCGAVPQGTIYSELFGHEKGAYTGASTTDARKGYFETADGGTIFLDEIGEMNAETQAMLLRVLENGEFIRMGSSKVVKTNVRVVAATNVNLEKAIQSGKFREDLFYRLSTLPIFVPALRERGADISLLFRKFASDFSEKYNMPMLSLTEDAKEVLQNFRFSGNVRQLKNIVDQISLLAGENRVINAQKLKEYLPNTNPQSQALTLTSQNNDNNNFSEREILFKIMFDLKNDVTELKKLVFQILQNGNIINNPENYPIYQEMLHQFENKENINPTFSQNEAIVLSQNTEKKNIIEILTQDSDEKEELIHDIAHEEANDILSIEEKEKELIIKALHKNKNRRKNAAIDLGISERTLYRKLKQYDLDN
ncbi:MAG: sigma-54-dependent Fis family transcriptional regulator [Bacteroidetes bacterium]|nr:MAG: sigma-54-dependent Fis family transcriptional regulator [Bacteroidota bacterium]TAG86672.1 MAG: sigma-54-dependent Fis family transcriptional regulator [Bacteroidota bacterium]